MSEMSSEDLLEVVRTVWEERDPLPAGLVARLQTTAALAANDTDLDHELMQLVERTTELAGARGGAGTAYTLRFAHAGVDLLVRVASDGTDTGARIDCWVVPPSPITVRVLLGTDADSPEERTVEVSDSGRFEVTGLAPGLLRLRLEPNDGSPSFVTPAFEI